MDGGVRAFGAVRVAVQQEPVAVQAEALQVYRDTHRLLGDELGLEPSVELSRWLMMRKVMQVWQKPALMAAMA